MALNPLLFYKEYLPKQSDNDQVPLLILHGLFGTLDNWHNISRKLQENRRVIGVDLRNHGKSFHSDEMDLELMADDFYSLIDHLELDHFDLLGHSMGGKVAMQFTNTYPGFVHKLIIADIGPKQYDAGHELIFETMLSLPIDEIGRRTEAEEQLGKIQDKGVRLFILKNIERKEGGGFQWKINLDAIYQNYEKILIQIPNHWPYAGEVLFMKGEWSNYITEEDEEVILEEYPEAQFVTIANAGHWLHADNSEDFLMQLTNFLSK